MSCRCCSLGWDKQPFNIEFLTLYSFGKNKEIIAEICQMALDLKLEKERDKVPVYVLTQWGSWRTAMVKDPRPIASVILDGSVLAFASLYLLIRCVSI